jgi:mono/diheme cytochrome c family protein
MKLVIAMAFVAAGAVYAQSAKVYDVVETVVLPKGDVRAGRQAFQNLKCHVCHRVAGDATLPAPIAELKGPDLTGLLQLQARSDLANAIISPTHSLSIRTSEAVKAQMWKQGASPMGDFSQAMTVRQLADLLAYLRTIR